MCILFPRQKIFRFLLLCFFIQIFFLLYFWASRYTLILYGFSFFFLYVYFFFFLVHSFQCLLCAEIFSIIWYRRHACCFSRLYYRQTFATCTITSIFFIRNKWMLNLRYICYFSFVLVVCTYTLSRTRYILCVWISLSQLFTGIFIFFFFQIQFTLKIVARRYLRQVFSQYANVIVFNRRTGNQMMQLSFFFYFSLSLLLWRYQAKRERKKKHTRHNIANWTDAN